MRVQRFALTGAAVLALALSGCASDTADANQEYCDAVASAQSEMTQLKTLITDRATADEIRDQAQSVRDAADQARSGADSLSETIRGDIEAANEAFDKAVDDIPGDATLVQAAAQYQDAVRAWEESVQQIRTEVGC
jgi:uncharacterized protein YukE